MSRVDPITAVLFDLDDTLNDRALSWQTFVQRLELQWPVEISPPEWEIYRLDQLRQILDLRG